MPYLLERQKHRHCRILMHFIEKGILKKYGAGRSVVYIKVWMNHFIGYIYLILNIFCLPLFA